VLFYWQELIFQLLSEVYMLVDKALICHLTLPAG
jgi:hypothetical protein